LLSIIEKENDEKLKEENKVRKYTIPLPQEKNNSTLYD
jgi:hypothetical protein